MKDYSAMSNEDIAKEVGNHLGLEWANLNANYSKLCYWKSGAGPLVFDPCNNPADAWPIIVANKISINHWRTGEWTADSFGGDYVFSDTPFRAAMICYLMMKDAEKCDG
jgi:hypothetical protein